MSLVIVLGLAGVFTQSPVAPESAAVSGRIVEEATLTPIAGAQVMLIRSQSGPVAIPDRTRTAMTDHDGRYQFDDLEPGRYRLTVRKAGFAALNGRGVPELDLEPGERHDSTVVTLQKSGVIVGRVLDDAGR